MFGKFLNFVKPRSFSLISRIYMYGISFFEFKKLCQKKNKERKKRMKFKIFNTEY